MTMTSRERFLAAVNHKEADQIPSALGMEWAGRLHPTVYKQLLAHIGIKENSAISEIATLVNASPEVLEYLGADFRSIAAKFLPDPPGSPVAERSEDDENYYFLNPWGAKQRMPKGHGLYFDTFYFPLQDAETQEDDDKYVWAARSKVDPCSIEPAAKFQQEGFATIFSGIYGYGFLQAGCHVYGFSNWLTMLASEPERVTTFNSRLLEKKFEWWSDKLDVLGDNIDVICESDDLGTQHGPFVSERTWKEFILPYKKEMFSFIKKKKPHVKILLHTDGSFLPLIPDLIDIGLDIMNPVQYSATGMDLVTLKREFGKDLTFWGGGVDVQSVLPNGTPQQVKDEVARNIDILRKDGGYVFSSCHNIQPDVPLENFFALIEAFRENCKY